MGDDSEPKKVAIPKGPPPPQRFQLDPNPIANRVWESLAETLSKDRVLDDIAFARKYLRNRRRSVLLGLINAKIGHSVAIADMLAVSNRSKDDENLVSLKAQQVDSALREVEAWTLELEAVVKIASECAYVDIIDKVYGDSELAKDNEDEAAAEGVPEAA